MMLLFGEKTRAETTSAGAHHCAHCKRDCDFLAVSEATWFCLFWFPIFKIQETGSYWQCNQCSTAFTPEHLDLPSVVPLLQKLSIYILLGYEHADELDLANEISLKLTNFEISPEDMRRLVQQIQSGAVDMVAEVRSANPGLNVTAKRQLLEAAFLATHACCELQYEDRLRINLIGNALDVGLEFVDFCIAEVRRQGYYGVRRLPLEV